MSLDQRDSFKDLQFDGQPSGYRDFRRKTLLAVASLEDKHAHLAGPRLLSRLSGQAWRATEHLPINKLRSSEGWLEVIKALDNHYRYLPETELHEAIEEFLFQLKRRHHEGATSFSSRFRTQLDRVQTLIAQERELVRSKRKKKEPLKSNASSSLEETSDDDGAGSYGTARDPVGPSGSPSTGTARARTTEAAEAAEAGTEPPAAASGTAAPEPAATSATTPEGTQPPPAEREGSKSASHAGSRVGSKRRHDTQSRGTYEEDHAHGLRKMQHMLGTLEPGKLKPTPIFPQSVLGHLYMRKYGLSREQRAQIIRATNGSSRFVDVERIMRASDLEETKDDRRVQKPGRREAYEVSAKRQKQQVFLADDDSSDLVDYENESSETGDDEVLAAAQEDEDDSENDEALEILEMHKKSKDKFRKAFRSYKESRKKVKEIRKSRQPYYPVVALNQPSSDAAGSFAQVPLQKQQFKYDRKNTGTAKGIPKRKPEKGSRKEEANFTETSFITEFNYMVELNNSVLTEEVLLTSIPMGFAIVDTGCTTSVIGEECAERMIEFLKQHHLPLPESKTLPPVELKGFSGEAMTTTKGLVWYVKLGTTWGTISTYVIPGKTAFLLSRRVLEGMNAQIHLGNKTLTSEKHGIRDMALRQATNGHLLMPLWELPQDWSPEEIHLEEVESDVCQQDQIEHEPNQSPTAAAARIETAVIDDEDSCSDRIPANNPSVGNKPNSSGPIVSGDKTRGKKSKVGITMNDKRSALQHIAKNTKRGMVDVAAMHEPLRTIFGKVFDEITHAFIAYRPRLERMPYVASEKDMLCSMVTLSKEGIFQELPWYLRPKGADRRGVQQTNLALFAYRESPAERAVPNQTEDHQCMCCCEHDSMLPCSHSHEGSLGLEVMYEELDWIEPQKKLSTEGIEAIKKGIQSLRKTSSQMLLTRVLSEPDAVERDLRAWLGPQADKLNEPVQMIEVFTGTAPLASQLEHESGQAVIRIGLQYGQNLDRLKDRQFLLCLIAWTRPRHIWYSWPCGDWGPWSRFNMSKNPQLKDEIMSRRQHHRRYLRTVAEAWNLQNILGGFNHAENPLSSDAWPELDLGEVYDIRVDQCAMGLRCPKTNRPVLKPTRIVTTSPCLAQALQKCRCDHKHEHAHLEGRYKGRNLSSWAEEYPKKFCRIAARALNQESLQSNPPDNHWSDELFAAEPSEQEIAPDSEGDPSDISVGKAKAIIAKLHVNTGHASPEQMMRLANRCQSSETIKQVIRNFRCSVCEELKVPVLHRKVTIPHAERPNQIVGVDFVQVEMRREGPDGNLQEEKYNVVTCVCMATDFCQQVIVPPGKNALSKAFHNAWTRAYGKPDIVYMDPAQITLSKDFQSYLAHHDIKLLHCAAEAHWQLGRLEIANRVLRGMAQKCWRTTSRPAEEVIETCASIRNQHMRKSGFSPCQWFLGHDVKTPGWLGDVSEQRNFPVQSQILSDETFADRMRLREEAARAFIDEHAKDTWRRAILGRNRPMRGPYRAGQLVYFYRRRGAGQLRTRFGVWQGPGRIVGVESSQGHHIHPYSKNCLGILQRFPIQMCTRILETSPRR